MTGLLVDTHGNLASELVQAVRRIVGDVPRMNAISIDWDDPVESARAAIEQGVHDLDEGDGVLILTDMFGGTPSNIALSLLEPGRIEIVSGVNLAMLIKFSNLRESLSPGEIAVRIASQGKRSIQVASELLGTRPAGDEGPEQDG
jgi:PTS system mannose-specific IIA component